MSDRTKICYRLNIDLQNLNLAAQRIEEKLSKILEQINPTLKDLQEAMIEHKVAVSEQARGLISSPSRKPLPRNIFGAGLSFVTNIMHVNMAKEKENNLRTKYDFLLEEKRILENERITIRKRIEQLQKDMRANKC